MLWGDLHWALPLTLEAPDVSESGCTDGDPTAGLELVTKVSLFPCRHGGPSPPCNHRRLQATPSHCAPIPLLPSTDH